MAIAKELWDKARALYELGNSLSLISDSTGIDKSSISKKAKSQGWIQGEIQQLKNEKINAVSSLVDAEIKIQQQIQPHQVAEFNSAVERELNIKQYAEDTQFKILDVMRKAAAAADKFIANNPEGMYVKSVTDKGTTYGLTTEVISHLAPVLNGATAITKDDKPLIQNNIQNNNTANAVADANLEAMVKRVLSSEDDSIINNLEESC